MIEIGLTIRLYGLSWKLGTPLRCAESTLYQPVGIVHETSSNTALPSNVIQVAA